MSARPIYEQINFLPHWYVERIDQRRWAERRIMIVLVLIAICGSVWIVTHSQRLELDRQLSALQSQVIAAEGKLTEVTKLQKAERELERSLRIYRQLARPICFHDVNATLGALTPENVFLNDLNARVTKIEQRIPVPGEKDRFGKPRVRMEHSEILLIELRGVAPSNLQIANYVGQLAGSNLFRDVKMIKSREEEQRGVSVRQFEIQMQVPLDRAYRLDASKDEVANAG